MWVLSNFLDWLGEVTAPKSAYGITEKQQDDVLWHARRGEAGRDFAEELGCHAYGMDTSMFNKLLTDYGISTK